MSKPTPPVMPKRKWSRTFDVVVEPEDVNIDTMVLDFSTLIPEEYAGVDAYLRRVDAAGRDMYDSAWTATFEYLAPNPRYDTQWAEYEAKLAKYERQMVVWRLEEAARRDAKKEKRRQQYLVLKREFESES